MSNFFTVFKVLLSRSYSFKKNSKLKNASIGITLLIFAALFLAISIFYNFTFYSVYSVTDSVENYPILFMSLVFIMTVFTSIFKSQTVLFSSKDHNILTPMPIGKKTIISVKLLMFYIEELMYSIIILSPTIVFYAFSDLSFIGLGLLALFIIPFLSILLSTCIGFIFSILVNKFKQAKIISTILYVLLFVGIMAGAMSISMSNPENASETYNGMVEGLRKVFIFDWIAKGFVFKDIKYLLILIGVSIISLIILTLMYSLFYDRLYIMLNTNYEKNKFKSSDIKASSSMKSYIAKDFKMLVTTPLALLNTIMGSIMGIIIGVLLLIKIKGFMPVDEAGELVKPLLLIIPVVIAGMISMSSFTAFGISAEKNSFWIIKTLPINKKDYLLSKIVTNYILNGPISLIMSIVLGIVLKLNVGMWFYMIIYPQMFIIAFSIIGLLINLNFPKLGWDNFNQIKNSTSLLIYTFGEMILFIILAIISFVLFLFINYIISIILTVSIILIILIISIILLKQLGSKLMEKVEC